MTITLKLTPEVEAGLLAQAQATGMTLDEFLARQLEALTRAAVPSPAQPSAPAATEEWEKELEEWLDSFPQHPVLSDEALKREDWYPDRW
ncbi:MAG TPA: hypothetical protein VIY49_38060 [Bryobacteraceae bacterium]